MPLLPFDANIFDFLGRCPGWDRLLTLGLLLLEAEAEAEVTSSTATSDELNKSRNCTFWIL